MERYRREGDGEGVSQETGRGSQNIKESTAKQAERRTTVWGKKQRNVTEVISPISHEPYGV